MYSTFG